MEFDEWLRDRLGEKNMTQKRLAELTGLTEVSVGRYVSGKRIPTVAVFTKIVDALGCSMGDLEKLLFSGKIIKACPLCGSDAAVLEDADGFYVECENPECMCKTRSAESREKAVEFWNKRKGN